MEIRWATAVESAAAPVQSPRVALDARRSRGAVAHRTRQQVVDMRAERVGAIHLGPGADIRPVEPAAEAASTGSVVEPDAGVQLLPPAEGSAIPAAPIAADRELEELTAGPAPFEVGERSRVAAKQLLAQMWLATRALHAPAPKAGAAGPWVPAAAAVMARAADRLQGAQAEALWKHWSLAVAGSEFERARVRLPEYPLWKRVAASQAGLRLDFSEGHGWPLRRSDPGRAASAQPRSSPLRRSRPERSHH